MQNEDLLCTPDISDWMFM